FARAGFVDGQGAAVVLLAVEGRDRGFRLGVTAHLDEPETLAPPGLPVGDDLGALDRAVLREELFQLRAIDLIAEVTDVQLLAHETLQLRMGSGPDVLLSRSFERGTYHLRPDKDGKRKREMRQQELREPDSIDEPSSIILPSPPRGARSGD